MEDITKKQELTKVLYKDWRCDFDNDIRFNYKFLKFLGLWTAKTNSEHLLRKISIVCTAFFLAIFAIPHGIYIIFVEPDNELRVKMLGPFSLMNSGKYTFALLKRGNFATSMKHMAKDWMWLRTEDERQLMLQAGQWTETFTKLCLTFMYSGTLSYSCGLPLIDNVAAAFKPNVTRKLMYPVSFGILTVDVATDQEFLFDLFFLILSISMFFMSTISIGMATLMAKFVMHACGQMNILRKYLMLINGDEDAKGPRSNFKIVAIRHLRILRFISIVDDSLSGICFFEILGCTFAICLLGHYILTEIERNNILFVGVYVCILTSYVSNIFILCFLSDRLTEQCREIGIWAYDVDLTRLYARGECTVGMQLIILVSQNPPQLTAGKIFVLSMEGFTSIMKAAATYLNMLRKFT